MNENLTPEIKLFLEKMIEEKGIKVNPELQAKMVQDMAQRLHVWFMQIVVEKLSAKELEQLNEVSGTGSSAKVTEFLKSKIENIDSVFAEAMKSFAAAFLKG